MDNIDELIRELEQRNRKELRWVSPEDLHISCVDVPDELCRRAAAGIRQLRQQNAELVEALIDMRNHINARDWDEDVSDETKATFAKATGDYQTALNESALDENGMSIRERAEANVFDDMLNKMHDEDVRRLEAENEELRKENERLRQRVEVLEGHLNGALNIVENFAHCDTTDARKALEGK